MAELHSPVAVAEHGVMVADILAEVDLAVASEEAVAAALEASVVAASAAAEQGDRGNKGNRSCFTQRRRVAESQSFNAFTVTKLQ